MRITALVLVLVLGIASYGMACGTLESDEDVWFKCGYLPNNYDQAVEWVPGKDLKVSEEAVLANIAFRAWYTSMYEE